MRWLLRSLMGATVFLMQIYVVIFVVSVSQFSLVFQFSVVF